MSDVLRNPANWAESDNMVIFDHFIDEALANLRYTTSTTDGGTATVGDTAGGVITILSSAAGDTDEDENWLCTINEVFLCGAGRALTAKARLKYAEADTSAANVFFGFASGFGANLLVDAGAGPRVTGNVIGIYKVDGGTVWRCVTRHTTSSGYTDTVSTATAGGTAWADLEVNVIDGGSTGASMVTFLVNGTNLKDSNGAPIIHYFLNSNAQEMNAGAYVKQGSATAQSILIDKWLLSGGQAA